MAIVLVTANETRTLVRSPKRPLKVFKWLGIIDGGWRGLQRGTSEEEGRHGMLFSTPGVHLLNYGPSFSKPACLQAPWHSQLGLPF